jgi:phage shock protein PspC (stress-responsive transcriptional regulator)
MKKTVSVNIKGMNFLIEEDAYELLQSYMIRLENSLCHEKGSKEIIEDIEYRVAELCSTYLKEKKQVIEKEDIAEIIKTLGQPEEYVDGIEQGSTEEHTQKSAPSSSPAGENKRLYRDIDHAKLAGVCSGIGNYLQIDPTFIRIFFLIGMLFFGFGFIPYIILWIVLPRAETTIDRLKMQGKPITVESVKEEVESAAKKIKEESLNLAHHFRKEGHNNQRLKSIFRFIGTFVGIGCVLVGLIQVAILLFLTVGIEIIPIDNNGYSYLSITDFGALILPESKDVFWMWAALLSIGFSSILFLLLLGSKLIFRLKIRALNIGLITLLISGLFGVFLAIFTAVKTGQDSLFKGEIERNIGSVQAEKLLITPLLKEVQNKGTYTIKSDKTHGFISIEKNKIISSGIAIKYRPSKDSLFHCYQNISSRAGSHKLAVLKAQNIRHNTQLEDKVLFLNTTFSFPKKDKLRNQRITMIIEIPTGKSVQIGRQNIFIQAHQFKEKTLDYHYSEEGIIHGNGEYSHDVDFNLEINF